MASRPRGAVASGMGDIGMARVERKEFVERADEADEADGGDHDDATSDSGRTSPK